MPRADDLADSLKPLGRRNAIFISDKNWEEDVERLARIVALDTREDQMNLPNAPVPSEGFLVTHFLTVSDQVISRAFYAGVLGGKVLAPENPCIIKLANSWIILDSGGGLLTFTSLCSDE